MRSRTIVAAFLLAGAVPQAAASQTEPGARVQGWTLDVWLAATVVDRGTDGIRVRFADGREAWLRTTEVRTPPGPTLASIPPGSYPCRPFLSRDAESHAALIVRSDLRYDYVWIGGPRTSEESTGEWRYDPGTGRIDWLGGPLDHDEVEGWVLPGDAERPIVEIVVRAGTRNEFRHWCTPSPEMAGFPEGRAESGRGESLAEGQHVGSRLEDLP